VDGESGESMSEDEITGVGTGDRARDSLFSVNFHEKV